MGLREYRRKRDFSVTPEPAGDAQPSGHGRSFVVQKHAASRLHYDFRLELEGVLKSWAVPKGPSLDPADKRLAMQTEDHPLEYADFEGIIPEGEYGGGTVMVWDQGTWEPVGNPQQALHRGSLKFRLRGRKLRGGFALVRIASREERDSGKSWLLIKEKDAEARPGYDVAALEPASVLSGRSLEQVKADRDRVWHSNRDTGAVEADVQAAAAKESHWPAAEPKRPRRSGVPEKPPPGYRRGVGVVEVAGVRLTHADRVVYPKQGITKRTLAEFYAGIARWVLPQLAGRPLTLVRCPEGQPGDCFFQKHVGLGAPESLRRVSIQEATKVGQYLVVDDLAGLLGLVQLGILEIHTWNSVADHLEEPDRLVFDLDPDPSVSWDRVVAAARRVRGRLHELDLESFVKTTGGKGLHVVVPLQRGPGWGETARFAEEVSRGIAREQPELYVAEMSKAKRRGRVFIDWLRNHRGATSVAAYSTRARPGAPVSTPLAWEELEKAASADAFTVKTVPGRLAALHADPWAGYATARQRLTAGRLKAASTR